MNTRTLIRDWIIIGVASLGFGFFGTKAYAESGIDWEKQMLICTVVNTYYAAESEGDAFLEQHYNEEIEWWSEFYMNYTGYSEEIMYREAAHVMMMVVDGLNKGYLTIDELEIKVDDCYTTHTELLKQFGAGNSEGKR